MFGVDDETMESVVLDLLRERGLTLAVAESLTGGLIAARLDRRPGRRATVLRGGVVSYATEVKFDVLGVPEGPVVTAEAAKAMADGRAAACSAPTSASAVTGVAGPDEQEGQPRGHRATSACAAGRRGRGGDAVRLPGDRERIREFATISLLDLLRRRLLA